LLSRLEIFFSRLWFVVRDLLAWNNVYLSAAVFVAGNILFLLLLLDKVSLVSLLSYVAMLELALSFVFVQCSNLFVGFLGSEFYSPPSLGKPYVTEESLSQQLDQLIPLINSAIDEWKKILFCTDNRRTLKLWFTAYILAKLGRFLSFMSLLYLCFLYFFTVPIMYHTFQELVDSTYQKVETIAYQVSSHMFSAEFRYLFSMLCSIGHPFNMISYYGCRNLSISVRNEYVLFFNDICNLYYRKTRPNKKSEVKGFVVGLKIKSEQFSERTFSNVVTSGFIMCVAPQIGIFFWVGVSAIFGCYG